MSLALVSVYLAAGVLWAREVDAYSVEKRRRPIRWTSYLGLVLGWLPLLIIGAVILLVKRGD